MKTWSLTRDTDVENKCMGTKGGKRGGGMNWETGSICVHC